MISKIKYEYLLGLISILWVLFFSFVLQLKPGFSSLGDDGSYLLSARLLYFNFKLDETRPLLISTIQGIPYLLNLTNSAVIKWGIFINFLSWFLTTILLFKIISRRFNRKTAFLFSIVFILCVGNLAHTFNFLSESIFIFMILLSIYFTSKYYETTKYYFLTFAISILLLNALIKPVSIGLALISIIFFIKNIEKIIFNKFSFFLIISFSLLFFQMYSLRKNYGDFTISYIGSITYYNYLGAKADCYKKGIEYLPGKNERTKKFTKCSSYDMIKMASNDFKNQLKNNTVNLFKAYLFCIYSNSSKGNYIVSECKNINGTNYFNFFRFLFKAISKVQNIFYTISSVLISIYVLINFRKIEKLYVIVSIFICYIFLISGMSCFQCDRFHIAFFPLAILLFATILKLKFAPNKYFQN